MNSATRKPEEALIVHANLALIYSPGSEGYCAQAGLSDCSGAVSTVDAAPTVTTVFFVIAAFPDSESPRLAGATFGIDYESEDLELLDHGHCADFALSSEGWPGPDSGTALTWENPVVDDLIELAWFAGYAKSDEAPTSFRLVEHPTQGAYFADDSVPSVLDSVTAFGALGFGEPAALLCPEGGELGAGTSGIIKLISR